MNSLNKNKRIFLYIIFCFTFFLFTRITHAATLSFSPSSKSLDIGKTVSVSVIVNSSGQAINNSEAYITFSKDLLEVTSVSKSGSIFSIWVEDPNYSNNSGFVSYNGGSPNPGFTGSSGKVITITFKAKKAGTASVVFSSASVRANDGLGTEVLTGSGRATITIGGEVKESETKSKEPETKTPKAPIISSKTHPDNNKWYSNNNIEIAWPISNDITSVRLLVSEKLDESPSISYSPAISEKKLMNFDNGVWYFHAQLKNANGWGDITHFRFQVDTENPEYFNIKNVEQEESTKYVSKLLFDASDKISGIDHYEISIDNGPIIKWQDDGSHTFTIPDIDSGKHILNAKVFDKAGNNISSSFEFEYMAESLDAPKFTDYLKELEIGSILNIKGITYPNSTVIIWIEKNKKDASSFVVKSDDQGIFTYKSDIGVEEGTYRISAQVQNADGLKSGISDKISIKVRQSETIRNIYRMITALLIMVIILVIIILIILIKLYKLRKLLLSKEKSQKQRVISIKTSQKPQEALIKEIKDQIIFLDKTKVKRDLTKEETQILRHLKRRLVEIEKGLY